MPVKQIIIKLFCIKMTYLWDKNVIMKKKGNCIISILYVSQVLNRIKIHLVLYSLWILFDTYQISIFFPHNFDVQYKLVWCISTKFLETQSVCKTEVKSQSYGINFEKIISFFIYEFGHAYEWMELIKKFVSQLL